MVTYFGQSTGKRFSMNYVLVTIYKLSKNIIKIGNISHYGLSKNGFFHVFLAQNRGEGNKVGLFSNILDMLKRKLL